MKANNTEYTVILKAKDGTVTRLTPEVLPVGTEAVLFKTNMMLSQGDLKRISMEFSKQLNKKVLVLPAWVDEVILVPAIDSMGK